MSNVLTNLRNKRAAGSTIITKVFQCVLSGSYVNGGAIGVAGETLNFNTALNPKKIARPKLPSAPAGKLPANTDFRVTRMPAGYTAQVEQNAASPTPANFVLRIFAAGSGAALPVELASGAYSAALAEATGLVIEVDVPSKYA